MTHASSVEPTGYPRIAPKSHAIAARRHPQWATCNFLVVPTSLGAAGSRYGVTGDEKVGTAAAVLVTMPDTMDTLLTSRARRVAVQRPRAHPVPTTGATVLGLALGFFTWWAWPCGYSTELTAVHLCYRTSVVTWSGVGDSRLFPKIAYCVFLFFETKSVSTAYFKRGCAKGCGCSIPIPHCAYCVFAYFKCLIGVYRTVLRY